MKNRKISPLILKTGEKKTGRILVLTGARQTGKTTLARALFPQYQFLSIEDPVLRETYGQLTAAQWKTAYPLAILDEVQKAPRLIESIKAAYDQWEDVRYVLTGSSQILLMEKVRESLAGRCTIIELYPLTLPELRTESWEEPVEDSPCQKLLQRPAAVKEMISQLLPDFRLDPLYHTKRQAWDFYCHFGAYPALTGKGLDDQDRRDWLSNYVRTYLERDVRDLASFRDLEPFIRVQRYLAQATAQLINYAEISRHTGISLKTVQRYVQYLSYSYQAIVLPPYFRNPQKRLAKAPKIHFLDQGVLQGILGKWGAPSGNEFESLVIAEIYKQSRTILSPWVFYHLRTLDGREVDLLLEGPEGFLAFEIKMTDRVSPVDARHLRDLSQFLDKPLIHSFVLSQDPVTRELSPGITALHCAYFLG
ncbi:MAG: AAA family ATPase [Breznakiellaceae bacterium]